METLAGLILAVAGVYLLVGLLVAIGLHAGKLPRFDTGTEKTGLFFHILITPGMMVFWPFLLRNLAKAKRNANPLPDPDRPVPAARLRSRHGILISTISVLVPILCALAIASRPRQAVNSSTLPVSIQTRPLARVVEERLNAFPGFDIATRIRSDRYRWNFQLELEVGESLPLAQPMVYWVPDQPGEMNRSMSQFIGPVEGPGLRRFAIPRRMVSDGHFYILSLNDRAVLNERLKGDA